MRRWIVAVLLVGAGCQPGSATIERPADSAAVGRPVAEALIDPHDMTPAALDSAIRARQRQPANTMSVRGADWLVRDERAAEEQPERMLDSIGVRPGMAVADIGAGVGYHTLRLADRVGPTGRVFATDIQPEMLERLGQAVRERGLTNVTAVRSGNTATGLPDSSVDLALMVDVYHELSQPERFLTALSRAFRPGGRLVLVEFRGEDPSVPIRPEHKMTLDAMDRELAPLGYVRIGRYEFLPWQHLAIYRPPPINPTPR